MTNSSDLTPFLRLRLSNAMMIFQKAFLLFLIILLTSCGRGNVVFNDVITISGTVFAPAGTIAQIQEKPFSLASFIVSDLYAAVTGLTPVAGAKVELIRINNAGIQIGDVLATTTTDMNGKYSLTLPNEGMTFPSSDLVIRVKGTTASELRAIVTGTTMNVSTVSEYVLEEVIKKIADNPAAVLPSHFTTNEIVALFALVNRYSLNLNSATTTAETMTQIANATTAHMASALVDLFPPGTQKILDTDGDRVNDDQDAFPEDPTETLDTDKDSVGNNADLDDDGDAFNDTLEISVGSDPLNPLSFPDIVPPSVPSGIAATSTLTTVSIAWPASTDHVGITHYIIMRGSLIATSTTPSFIDTNLLPKTTYTYTLQACDRANNCSATSTPIMVTTLTTLTPPFLTIGGTVTGLAGGSLTLQNNSGDNLATSTNGSFVFTAPIASGSGYSVSVLTQPTTPSQTCSVTNGTGTVGNANVMNVGITCTTNTYTISGAVTGLAGGSLVLQNNSGDNLATSTNGSFVFTTSIISGSGYSVSVFAQPTTPSQTCSVTNGTGTVGNANVMNISIVCIENTIAIGGTVTGLAGSGLLLQNNSGDNLATSTNGSFVFTAPIASGSSYNVSVFAQPTTPSQTCSVTNGTGTASSTPITNLLVTCTTNTYTIGGAVTGLSGSGLVLQNNSGDNLATSTNGSFVFTAPIASGSSYNVSVFAQPTTPSQTCSVTNATGTASSTNVMDVSVGCGRNDYTLMVTKIGNGVVTSSIGELNCGTVCSKIYNVGQLVTLTATPDGGYLFSGWNMACNGSGTSTTCDITMNADQSVTAQFLPLPPTAPTGLTIKPSNAQVTLTWNTNPAGENVTSYTLYMAKVLGVTKTVYEMVHPNVTSPYKHIKLKNGISHYFIVTASNAGGEGTASLEVSAIPGMPIASVKQHSCAVSGSKVQCWGRNVEGQLGDGTTLTPLIPVFVSGITTATAVGTGYYHSCALLSNGVVNCWGENIFGQLGNATTTSSNAPVAVVGIATATEIWVGPYHNCALLLDGTVKCWGHNERSQLGDRTQTNRSTPVTALEITDAVAVWVGGLHSCTLLANGTVKCWGYNREGQLGDGSKIDRPVPVEVLGITTATAIAGSNDHSCALLSDGTLKCWGLNDNGQLGNGTTTSTTSPIAVLGITTGESIGAGLTHTCALLLNSTIQCWGANLSGQLGNGTATSTITTTPITVSGITTGSAVASGEAHTCAALSDYTVNCWGENDYSQLGDGAAPMDSSIPVLVREIP